MIDYEKPEIAEDKTEEKKEEKKDDVPEQRMAAITKKVKEDIKKRENNGEPEDKALIRDYDILLGEMAMEDCLKPERPDIKEKLCDKKYNVNQGDPLR